MRLIRLAAFALAATLAGTAANAQDACAYWNQQMQAADRGLMQQITGVWRTQEPDGNGGMADVQVSYAPDGTMTYDRRACYSMPGLGTSCPTSSGYGAWVAHYSGQGGAFFLATNLRTSLSNGQATQGCGGFNAYLADPSTMVGQNGQVVARRVR
jgi:hypothetical protein